MIGKYSIEEEGKIFIGLQLNRKFFVLETNERGFSIVDNLFRDHYSDNLSYEELYNTLTDKIKTNHRKTFTITKGKKGYEMYIKIQSKVYSKQMGMVVIPKPDESPKLMKKWFEGELKKKLKSFFKDSIDNTPEHRKTVAIKFTENMIIDIEKRRALANDKRLHPSAKELYYNEQKEMAELTYLRWLKGEKISELKSKKNWWKAIPNKIKFILITVTAILFLANQFMNEFLEFIEKLKSHKQVTVTQKENSKAQHNKEITNIDIKLPAYVICESAYDDIKEAQKRLVELNRLGYSNTGLFWVPDYKYLSGAEKYQVYIGPFNDRNDAIEAICNYKDRKEISADYGVKLSDEPGRLEFRCSDIKNFSDEYSGVINNKYQIEMKLSHYEGEVTGSYYYKSGSEQLKLIGTINQSKIKLKEYDEKGNQTGYFEGNISENSIDGIWENPAKSRKFSFHLVTKSVHQ